MYIFIYSYPFHEDQLVLIMNAYRQQIEIEKHKDVFYWIYLYSEMIIREFEDLPAEIQLSWQCNRNSKA